jgi:hypothetical protein
MRLVLNPFKHQKWLAIARNATEKLYRGIASIAFRSAFKMEIVIR